MAGDQHASNTFAIEVDGTPLSDDVMAALLEASVEDELNLPDAFELVFRDPLRKIIGAGGFEIGKPLTISVVSEATPAGVRILDGEITALEAEIERDQTLTVVRGYDKGHRLQRGTRTETHLDVTYGDIAAKVAGRHGLQRGEGGTSSVVHEAVVQWNESDWEFLSALAAETGHEVVVVDGALHFREPASAEAGPEEGDLQTATSRQLVAGGNLLRLRASVSGTEQVEEVKVRGWDPLAKEAVEGTARTADAVRSVVAGTGSSTLAGRLGGGTLVKVDLPVEKAELAQAAADSLVEQLGSAAVELDGAAFGNPDLRAGVTVSLSNLGAPFDGKYVLTSCRHVYDPVHGYVTSFRVSGRQDRTLLGLVNGGAPRRARGGLAGVVPAIVSNIDDPAGLGRMKVTFPWMGEQAESPWARVAMAGAGNERGFVFLPEVGDEVLVAFDHGDPRMPYIVGGLYNGRDAMPVEAVRNGEVVVRTLVSRHGHRVELHDADEVVTIATGDGKQTIVLDQASGKVTINTTGNVEVAAEQALTIDAATGITLQSDGELTLKANGISLDAGAGSLTAKGVSTKLEGSGSTEVTSSGTLTVRGAVVNIN
jgi:uncharacterized protein involved in type VI secretion and phage assembly